MSLLLSKASEVKNLLFPVVENPPANAGDARGMGSNPSLGRSPGVGRATHTSILVWEIPWAEEPGGLQ